MMFINESTEGKQITPSLERFGFVSWLNESAKVITNAIRSWGVTGKDATLIGEAWEVYDKTGQNTLVGHEIAVIAAPTPDGIPRTRTAFNAVLKGRMDSAPPGPLRHEQNSVGFLASAHPEMRMQSVAGAMPNTLYGGAVNIPNNPGASVAAISEDMVRSMGGQRCAPLLLDGKEVGLQMVENEPPTVGIKTADGVGWFAIYDYGHRQEGRRDGTGSFLPFRSRNDAGEWKDAVLLNGGMISREAGNEQGDLDILWLHDGKINGVAGVGDMSRWGGPPAGFQPILDRTLSLGFPDFRWTDVCFSGRLDAITQMKTINGTMQECIEVKTQHGTRWLPVFQAV